MGDGKEVAARLTSLQNPRVKRLAALRDRRARLEAGLTLVEGRDEIALALESGARPAELVYAPDLIQAPDAASLLDRARAAGAVLVEVDERVFRKLAYREHPDGWLAAVALRHHHLDTLCLPSAPLLLVSEGVEKPGNLGAMLRTADAAGVDAVIACDPRTDWGNPNVIRASKGALFALQVADAPTTDVQAWLRARNVRPVVATPEAPVPYTACDLRGAVAVVVGAEHEGVSNPWLAGDAQPVAIPMVGRVNSLNVSIAAALLLYEALRQRMSAT